MRDGIALPIVEASQAGEARRVVTALADQLGFDAVRRGNAALVATECATNLVKHARDGRLILQPRVCGDVVGIDLLALDNGPGIADLGRCRRDGFSTSGTPGTGLGAIQRLSALTDAYSKVPGGTVLLARLWPGAAPKPERFMLGSVCIPAAGEAMCGDAWTVEAKGRHAQVLLADGLGHGPLAADAAHAAVRVMRENRGLALAALLEAMHAALRSTRGAALALAQVDPDHEILCYAGIGNVAGVVLHDGKSRSLVSHNGIVGHEARKRQEFTCPFPRGAVLVLHSDGLSTRWNLEAYPGLLHRDPSLIAGVVYRDAQRGRDDATVLVLRAGEGSDA